MPVGQLLVELVAQRGPAFVPGRQLDWSELTTVVSARFPDRSLVGYTRGEELDAATAAGFEVVGDLRVWMR